jgi:membrane protease YdiL (CAAX protease family)
MSLPPVGPDGNGPHGGCQPWGFWATTAFGVMAVVVWFAAQLSVAMMVLAWLGVGPNATAFEIETMSSHAVTIAMATILSMPAPIAVIAVAARLRGCAFAEYLALYRPTRADLIVGLVFIAILLPLGDLSSWLTGRELVPQVVVEAYRSARSSGTLVLLAVALVIAAPLMEELLFRGFLFAGYAASRLGPWGAIVLTSVGWAVMHVQYETFHIVQIFILGCAFGWLRWRSGSTLLTVILHAIVNALALIQVAVVVESAS